MKSKSLEGFVQYNHEVPVEVDRMIAEASAELQAGWKSQSKPLAPFHAPSVTIVKRGHSGDGWDIFVTVSIAH